MGFCNQARGEPRYLETVTFRAGADPGSELSHLGLASPRARDLGRFGRPFWLLTSCSAARDAADRALPGRRRGDSNAGILAVGEGTSAAIFRNASATSVVLLPGQRRCLGQGLRVGGPGTPPFWRTRKELCTVRNSAR